MSMDMLLSLATLAPWLLLWVVAGVLAAVWWTRHPLVSALVVTGSVIHILTGIAGRVMPMLMVQRGESVSALGLYSAAIGLVGLVGSACLVAAVFVGRQGSGASSVPGP
jgi:hypothetical protein